MRKILLPALLLLQFFMASAQSPAFIIPYRQGDRWGFCDTLGKVLIKPQFDSASFFTRLAGDLDASLGTIYSKAGSGLINPQGRVIVPPQFEWIVPYGNRYAVVRNGKVGLYSSGGQVLLPLQYDAISPADYHTPILILQQKTKYGLYHPELKRRSPQHTTLSPANFIRRPPITERFSSPKKAAKNS